MAGPKGKGLNTSLPRQKHFWRRLHQDAVRQTPAGRRRREARRAAARLSRLGLFRRARVVGLYASRPHELDTRPLIALCRRMGKAIVLPVVDPDRKVLRFALWAPRGRRKKNVYGILEPEAKGRRWFPARRVDIVVAPGAAFTKDGKRLGSGGGYYDRFLARHRRPAVGLAHAAQMTVSLPSDRRDRRVSVVVTADKVYQK